ncbi:hypothetical protein LguiA_027101 [Lonicera macranthoides]
MTRRTEPIAVFMAFGTKGDVHPIAAIAAAFACDQEQYRVVFVTHSTHESLGVHLATKDVEYVPVSSPPFLSPYDVNDTAGSAISFSLEKRKIRKEHREECVSVVEGIFGDGPSMESDLIIINFFALEGWSLAELFNVRCVVAAPYVVPYSAPSSFERHFKEELPLLYEYLQEAPINKVSWKDVIHWMWPLFTEDWDTWRSCDLKLSPRPFTDPVTDLPTWHDRSASSLLLYGFSKEVVECPGYWPSNVRVCGFWFLPTEWQFSCSKCGEISALITSGNLNTKDELCSAHNELQSFLKTSPVFIGLSSVGRNSAYLVADTESVRIDSSLGVPIRVLYMGFLRKPQAFLHVLQAVLHITTCRFILFSTGYEPLDAAIRAIATEGSSSSEQGEFSKDGISLFCGRLYCFSGTIPYSWLFPRCAAAIHHGGSGSTAAALHAGIPQVVCPFMMDQFYWAERLFWLGVGPEPLKRHHLVPDEVDEKGIKEAASILARAIDYALSPEIKARASEIAEKLSLEDGVSEAVKALKEELSYSKY